MMCKYYVRALFAYVNERRQTTLSLCASSLVGHVGPGFPAILNGSKSKSRTRTSMRTQDKIQPKQAGPGPYWPDPFTPLLFYIKARHVLDIIQTFPLNFDHQLPNFDYPTFSLQCTIIISFWVNNRLIFTLPFSAFLVFLLPFFKNSRIYPANNSFLGLLRVISIISSYL